MPSKGTVADWKQLLSLQAALVPSKTIELGVALRVGDQRTEELSSQEVYIEKGDSRSFSAGTVTDWFSVKV